MPDCSLPRTERLRSLGAVRRMFESGESGFIFPFRYVWFAEADEIPSKEELSYKTISNAVRRILETVAEHL